MILLFFALIFVARSKCRYYCLYFSIHFGGFCGLSTFKEYFSLSISLQAGECGVLCSVAIQEQYKWFLCYQLKYAAESEEAKWRRYWIVLWQPLLLKYRQGHAVKVNWNRDKRPNISCRSELFHMEDHQALRKTSCNGNYHNCFLPPLSFPLTNNELNKFYFGINHFGFCPISGQPHKFYVRHVNWRRLIFRLIPKNLYTWTNHALII